MSDLTVANTILAQLGGAGRLSAMIGAKNFVGSEDSLQFQFTAPAKNQIKGVVIRLDPSDTYTMRFWKNLRNPTVVLEVDDVYAESLVDVFERTTGLYLTFTARRNPGKQRRYIARCKACKTTMSTLADSNLNPSDADLGDLVPGGVWDIGKGEYGLPCASCGKLRHAHPVKGVYNAKVPCNTKCLAAKGFDCECSCGGKNHGASWGVS